jgi:hypothetical protein
LKSPIGFDVLSNNVLDVPNPTQPPSEKKKFSHANS